jgi:V/A-type H+/Na+-transporting ATPase subunit A
MSAERFGILTGINGNMARVEFKDYVMQNEVAFILHNEERLKSEVIRVTGNIAELQIYEDTKGLRLGEKVEFTGELLSVELGPGLLGQIYACCQARAERKIWREDRFYKRRYF